MAAATSIILGATALASTGMGVAKSVKEAKMAKEAQKKIDNYERQDIDFKNYLAMVDVPTEQYTQDMKRIQQQADNYAEQVSSAGARGMSLLPQIQENLYAQEDQAIAKYENMLYEYQRQAAMMQSQQDMEAFRARENREQRELAGYGALYEAGRQGMYSGIGDAIQGVQSIAGQASGWDLSGLSLGRNAVTTLPTPQLNTRGMQEIVRSSDSLIPKTKLQL